MKKNSILDYKLRSVEDYIEIMENLKLPKPKLIDINISRNIKLGAT